MSKKKVTTIYEYNESGVLLKKTVIEETEEKTPVLNNLADVLSDSTSTTPIPAQYHVPSYLKTTPIEYSDKTTAYYTSADKLEGTVGVLSKVEG